jgi:predicted small lipoprotein YifL
MRIARAIPFLVLAVALVLVLAACGGKGGGY